MSHFLLKSRLVWSRNWDKVRRKWDKVRRKWDMDAGHGAPGSVADDDLGAEVQTPQRLGVQRDDDGRQ